jgi:hypothetical protein
MRVGSVSHSLLMLIVGGTASLMLAAGYARAALRAQTDLVEFEKMTWVEVKSALAADKTTALICTGGVEERGPQNANGGLAFDIKDFYAIRQIRSFLQTA